MWKQCCIFLIALLYLINDLKSQYNFFGRCFVTVFFVEILTRVGSSEVIVVRYCSKLQF